MSTYTINRNTSVVPVDTRHLQGGSTSIVYISSTDVVGQIVTIYDAFGCLSSPQAIVVSSLVSPFSAHLYQRFSYLTIQSVSDTTWKIINQNAISNPATHYFMRGLAFSGLNSSNASLSAYISSSVIETPSLTIQSSFVTMAPLFCSTLGVNTAPSRSTLTIGGAAFINGDATIFSSIQTTRSATLGGPTTFTGPLSTQGNVAIGGTFTGSSNILVQGQLSTGYATLFQGTMSTGGTSQIGPTRINGNMSVSSLAGNALNTTTLMTNKLAYANVPVYHTARGDISLVDPTYTGVTSPVVEISPGLTAIPVAVADSVMASYMRANALVLSNTFTATSMSSMILGSTNIQNASGSLTIGSMTAQTIAYNTILGPGGQPYISSIRANTITGSSISLDYATTGGNVNMANIVADLTISKSAYTNSLRIAGGSLITKSMTLSTLNISSGTNTDALSSIVLTGGQIRAYAIYTGSANTPSTLVSSINTNHINSATQVQVSAPYLQIGQATSGSCITSTHFTSSIVGTKIQLGVPLAYSTITPNGIYMIPSTNITQTKYEYVTGIGTNYSPAHAVFSKSQSAQFYPGNAELFANSYINAEFTYTNNGDTNGSAGLRIMNPLSQSTIVYFNANPVVPVQRATIYNYPVDLNIGYISTIYTLSGLSSLSPISSVDSQILVSVGAGPSGGVIAYSRSGGASWTSVNTSLFGIAALATASNGKIWLAIGRGAQNNLAYSYTGVDWFGLGLVSNGKCVAWNGVEWLLVGAGGAMLRSYDGISWSTILSPFTTDINTIATNGPMWVIGSTGGGIAYSYNLIGWYIVTSPFTTGVYGVATSGTEWVAVGEGGFSIAHSYDGITWTGVASPFTTRALCVAWSGTLSKWVAGGQGGQQIATSSDGISWSGITYATNIVAIVATSTTLIASEASGGFAQSTDGVAWSAIAGSSTFSSGATGLSSRAVPTFTEFLCATTPSKTFTYSIGRKRWVQAVNVIFGQANSFAWNGRRWVAGLTGGLDTIAYSDDGINWIGIGAFVFGTSCFQIAWNGYMWIGTGQGTNTLAYSYNGSAWFGLGSAIFTTAGYGIAVGGGKVVATGQGGNTLAYSYNGINWVANGSPFFSEGRKLVYSTRLGIWVAGGIAQAGTSLIYSTDGISWTAAVSQPFPVNTWDIATNGGAFVAVGDSGGAVKVAYSTDGSNWTGTSLSASGKGVAWTGSKWAVTCASAFNPIIFVSANGQNWSSENASMTGPAYTLASNVPSIPYESLMIACGQSGSNLMAITSDGLHWLPVSVPFTASVYCVAWNGTQWVAGGAGTYQLAYSADGINWTGVTIPNMTAVRGVAWGSKGWVVVGEGDNTHARSTNGINWIADNSAFLAGYGIIYANGLYIGSGITSGGITTSIDAITWLPVGGGLFDSTNAVNTDGSILVAVGQGPNTMAFSGGGANWIGIGTNIFSVAGNAVIFGNGLWVAVGQGTNTLAISIDGMVWSGLGTTIFTTRGTGVTWNGSIFVATGEGTNTLATSTDGFTWVGQGATTFTSATYLGNPGCANSVTARRVGPPFVATPVREATRTLWGSIGPAGAVSQTTIKKIGNASNMWDAVVYSLNGYTQAAYMSYTIQSISQCMVGLSEAPGVSVSTLNYSFFIQLGGQLDVYEQGFQVIYIGTYSVGDTFEVIFTGTAIQYYHNSVLVYTRPRGVGPPLYATANLYTAGQIIAHIEYNGTYSIAPSTTTQSATAVIGNTEAVLESSLAPPFYYTLTSNIPVSNWSFDVALSGNVSTTFYADVYLNQTKLFTTNTIPNTYVSSFSTYQLTFDVPAPISLATGDTLNIRLKGTKFTGDLNLYGNWLSVDGPQISSNLISRHGNPNGLQYLEFFHTSPLALQTSELAVWLSPTSTNTASYVDSNYGIEMNMGALRWNSTLYGTTIENRFNDISTRSLTYTGALYNASDKNLKRDIEYISAADYEPAFRAIPLRRFAFSDAYCSTFRLEDRHQLGVIATEVKAQHADAVHTTPTDLCGLSTIESVDRQQLRYLHLNATQALLRRVSTLCGRIDHLRYLSSLVEARSG